MADDAGLRTEARHVGVARVACAQRVHADVRTPAVAHPVARERPRRAAPDLVRAELLEQWALVCAHVARAVGCGRDGVVGVGKNRVRCARAKGQLDEALVVGRRDSRDAAEDGRGGLVLDVRDQDRLGHRGERRGRVERGRDEAAVLDDADTLACSHRRVERERGVEQVILGVKDIVERETVCAVCVRRVAVEEAVEVVLERGVCTSRKEAVGLPDRQN